MFNLKFWRQDLRASLSVFLIALPLCLGIALASHMPVSAGLIAGVIGGLLVGLLTDSPVSVSGPAAALAVLVVSALLDLGSTSAFALSVMVSGFFQILFGALRFGDFADFFPSSVVKGMLAALGLIVIVNQLPSALTSPGISLFTLLFIFLWERLTKGSALRHIPGPFLAVVLASGLSLLFSLEAARLEYSFDPQVALDWQEFRNPLVYLWGLTFALVGSLLTSLSLDTGDRLDPKRKSAGKNRELLVQGLANSFSGFLGGLPLTAVYVRTSANHEAGGRTRLSTMLHGLWLLLSVLFLGRFFTFIPTAALAAVLIVVGGKLNRPALYRSSFAHGSTQFIPFIVTILSICSMGVLPGLGIGLIVGGIFIVRENQRKCMTLVSEENCYLLRFYKDVSFLNKLHLKRLLDSVPPGAELIIDRISGVYLDQDIEEVLEEYLERAAVRGIQVEKNTITGKL